jgi:drug/metabolite transporter (DMT)-like permease
MKDQDAFAATEIRVIAGIFGLGLIISFSRNWRKVAQTIRIRKDMVLISTAAFVGSFLGVSLSLLAIKHTNTGVASTLMAIQPILMIPASIIFLKEKSKFCRIFWCFYCSWRNCSILFMKRMIFTKFRYI